MRQRTLVPDVEEVVLQELRVEGRNRLLMVLGSAGEESSCPGCGQRSRRVRSRYARRLSDLPWEGIAVRIELCVRRFFCGADDCGQHIFTERLPRTVQRCGRRTCRLADALSQIALALGGWKSGEASCRGGQHLGVGTGAAGPVAPGEGGDDRSGA